MPSFFPVRLPCAVVSMVSRRRGVAPHLHAYLGDVTWNVHCDDAYRPLREEFGERLKKLQFRYQDPSGKWRGGIVVSDRRTAQPSSLMFRPGKADAHAVMIPVQQTGGGSLPSGV
ncbi:hypothetical protein [Streptomyces sp. XHT-2]|uniref:hypothetical protein n=1 Tax=Streptomyces sp. XHT-2 TaxID=2692621 RepID=UPI001F3D068F|nr:hypothetical protein OG692_14665 [Streptomyces cellulosae]